MYNPQFMVWNAGRKCDVGYNSKLQVNIFSKKIETLWFIVAVTSR